MEDVTYTIYRPIHNGHCLVSSWLILSPMTSPQERRRWRLLEEMRHQTPQLQRWRSAGIDLMGDGQYHHVPTLILCLSGTVRLKRGTTQKDLQAGQALMIEAGVRHHHAPLRHDAVAFSQGLMATWSDVILADRNGAWHGRLPLEPARHLLTVAMSEPDMALATQAVAHLIAQVCDESIEELNLAHPAIRRMLDVLWNDLHLGVSTEDLIKASGLGRSQAWALFTAAYGISPHRALVDARLALADRLLAAGHGVAETARLCGFGHPATFSRQWRTAHGRSPRQNRNGYRR